MARGLSRSAPDRRPHEPTAAALSALATPRSRHALVAILCLASIAWVFRDALHGGLHILYGDSYDGVIEVAILEHWHRVVTAGAAWDVTGYFHPYPGTLGYNDTYLIPGIPFTLARIAGANPFLAAFTSHVAMKAAGFAGMYVLLRRGLAIAMPLALAGAVLFATANVSLLHMYHAQLLSVGLLPWLGFLTVRTIAAVRDRASRRVLGWGCGFALLYGASAFSAFYALWFFSLFLAISMPVALLVAERHDRRAIVMAAASQWRPLAACGIVAMLALVPTLLLYLPKLGDAQHAWRTGAYLYLPSATTLFDVGSGNLVWGRLPAALGYALPLPGGEVSVGLPIGLIAATLFATLWASRAGRQGRMVIVIGASLAIMLALALRWPGDHSAWWYVHAYVPGAAAIRVVSRLLVFALVGVIAMVMLFLGRAPRPAWLTVAILGGLLVEQVQLAAPLALDRAAQMAMLRDVGPPPVACDAFVVVSARPAGYPVLAEAARIDRAWGGDGGNGAALYYRHNADAMLLASYYGRPTINGFSSANPPDWAFAAPDARDYPARVRAYATRHRLARLCGLDMRRTPHWFAL